MWRRIGSFTAENPALTKTASLFALSAFSAV
jgi:hypothetical protein